jgi:hypothetical protein
MPNASGAGSLTRVVRCDMNIPADLHTFLSNPENLRATFPRGGEIERLRFYSADELKLAQFTVDSWELHHNGPLPFDPEESRQYEGYSLVQDCNDYDPMGVLVWFPCFSAYGSADVGHERIIIYPSASWPDILAHLGDYANGQWYPEKVPHEEVNPWA